jgi:hypothetical protein
VPKTLVEVWQWDKNQLMRVESDGWALNFIYKGKQVIKIESGDMVANLTYADKDTKLKKIEFLDEKGRPELNLIVDDRNSDNKISKLTYESFTYTEDEDKALHAKMRPVLSLMLGDNLGETVLRDVENTTKMQKATKTEKVTTQVVLTYEGNNVREEARTIVQEGVQTVTQTARYKYDNKSNPYYHAFCMIFGTEGNYEINNFYTAPISENNIISYYLYVPVNDVKNPEKTVDSADYVYKYNGDNFPTERDKITVITNSQDTSKNNTEHIIYYYEYITK